MRGRLLVAALAANIVLTLTALGWLAWISGAPKYWFPGAYAQKGERGDQGPRGPVGPAGPEGPVGPDAADAISGLESELSDLDSRLSDLETGVDVDALQSQVDDVESTVSDICDELLYSDIEPLNDIYYAAC